MLFFKRIHIKFCIWKSNWFLSIVLAWPLKVGPKLKKGDPKMVKKKHTQAEITRDGHQFWFFSLYVRTRWGLCEKVVLIWPLTYRSLATSPFVREKNQNTTKSKYIFHWKFRGDRACILRYLDSSMDNFFSVKMLTLLNFDPLQEVNWAKVCSKMQTLSTFCGCKNLII